MRKLFFAITAIATVSIAMIGCKKIVDKTNIEPITQNELNVESTSKFRYVNPFDFVGEIHNEVLSSTYLNQNFLNMTVNQRIVNISLQFNTKLVARNLLSLTCADPQTFLGTNTINMPLNISNAPVYYESQIINLKPIEKSELAKLIKIFDDYMVNPNWTTFNNSVNNLESKIASNALISKEIQDKLLASIALGKASFNYWNTEGPGLPSLKIKPWLADLGGFVTGFGGTVWGNATGQEWGNPFANGGVCGTLASAAAR